MGGKPVKRQILPRDWRKERGPDFHPAQLLRTNSLLIDAALRTTHHFTHSNRISRLTNEDKIANPLSPTSHQYWGRDDLPTDRSDGATEYRMDGIDALDNGGISRYSARDGLLHSQWRSIIEQNRARFTPS